MLRIEGSTCAWPLKIDGRLVLSRIGQGSFFSNGAGWEKNLMLEVLYQRWGGARMGVLLLMLELGLMPVVTTMS